MKKYSLYFFLLLTACSNSSDPSDVNNDSSRVLINDNNGSMNEGLSGCYRQVIGRDTILLQLEEYNARFTGKMEFDNFEKDASNGTVKGHLENGNIVLWYDFNSEGMQSVMEVILKPVSLGLIRAVGDVTSKGDTVLLNHDKINFDPSNTLYQVDCLH
jgi:hypothetical protein